MWARGACDIMALDRGGGAGGKGNLHEKSKKELVHYNPGWKIKEGGGAKKRKKVTIKKNLRHPRTSH